MRSHLGSDPLVLSTQPEQVPTLAYYLPAVKRFGTPMGRVPDPRVVDWRNALVRLRRSSVHSVLLPMVDRLRSGQRVLFVIPSALPQTPLYLKLIDKDSDKWSRALYRDRALKLLAVSTADAAGSGLPVRAALYVKR
jgi:hypothetical protein